MGPRDSVHGAKGMGIMRKHRFLAFFGLCAVLFSSLNCSAISTFLPSTATPTATSTLAPTLTPSPTPTLMPTPTPTPIPDYVLAKLQASDLPAGFFALPPPVRSDQSTIWFSYGYGDQIIFGMVSRVNPGEEQFNFDTVTSTPRLFSAFLALEFTNAKITDVKLYPGLNRTALPHEWLNNRAHFKLIFS